LARETDPTKTLIDELVLAVCAATGVRPDLAMMFVTPCVRHLQELHGGEKLYIPRPGRTYPVAAMRRMWKATGDVDLVCSEFGVSRAQFYRLVPSDAKLEPGDAAA
jgi:hypothetical protein